MSLFSPSAHGASGPMAREDVSYAPLLFSLTPADAVATPRSAHRNPHTESMSAQRGRSMNTSGSVHTEATPQAMPPPVSRLDDTDVQMQDASTTGRQGQFAASPVFIGSLGSQAPLPQAPQYEDVWVTVFGFTQAEVPLVLREFATCGEVIDWGTFGVPQGNFAHIKYQNKYAAQRALARNGEHLTPFLIVGVKPLDPRHRESMPAEGTSSGGQENILQIRRPTLHADRPYRLQQSSTTQQIPLPARSLVSKVAEFVFGI